MKFKPGQSGNPGGKLKGTLNTTTKMRAVLAEGLPEAIEALKKQAADGEVTAIKILLDRVLPPLRPIPAPQPMPFTANTPDDTAATSIVEAATSGEIDADTAASWLNLIGARRRLDADINEEEAQRMRAEARAKTLSEAFKERNNG